MKRFVLTLIACIATLPALAGDVTFTEVRYAGDDGGPGVGSMLYRNPIVAGFYPDPPAIRMGDDFYLITSTFGCFPGLCAAWAHDV